MSIFNSFAALAGGGAEIETGVFFPNSAQTRPVISFAKEHSSLPIFVEIQLDDGVNTTANTTHAWWIVLWSPLTGHPLYPSTSVTSTGAYGYSGSFYRTTSSTSLSSTSNVMNDSPDKTESLTTQSPRYYLSESNFRPLGSTGNAYFRSYAYKWIAVWLPEE